MFVPPVILDTNVFVGAGFNPDSASAKILGAIADGELVLVWNEATRAETLAVLDNIPPLRDRDWSCFFDERDRWEGRIHRDHFQIVDDESDRKFAALAEATGVVLVSNDEDLLGPRAQLPVLVLRPSEFVERSGVFCK